ncbi:DUF1900-domain-containing protein [Meredithblackwellia eburnea MCA 4105]
MAPRFYSSPFKNAVASIPKRDEWWSELPISTSAASDSADLIHSTNLNYVVAQASTQGSLLLLPYQKPQKYNKNPPRISLSNRQITDFDTSNLQDIVAAGTDQGEITISRLPSLDQDTGVITPYSESPISLSSPSQGPLSSLSFHPTTSSLLLSAQKNLVSVFDFSSSSAQPLFNISLAGTTAPWSVKWSDDGRVVSTVSRDDGKLKLWDIRKDPQSPSLESSSPLHSHLKPIRHLWLSDNEVFSTGFSKMREREYSLSDIRNLGAGGKVKRVDNGTTALLPVVDRERKIVYFAGKGDMTLRWVEIGGPSTFTEGATSLPAPLSSLTLSPVPQLQLMKGEINKLFVVTQDAVVPISVQVPRRQYIDFHQDLYPDVRGNDPAQTAQEWKEGRDAQVDLINVKPGMKFERQSKPSGGGNSAAASPSPSQPTVAPPAQQVTAVHKEERLADPEKKTIEVVKTISPTFSPSPAPVTGSASTAAQTPTTTAPTPAPVVLSSPASATPAPAVAPTPSPEQSSPTPFTSSAASKPTSTPSNSTVVGGAPFNPSWSRKFLAGKTPLKPDYHDVHGLSTTTGADVQLLKANAKSFFFPLAGPGGRIAVHPISAKGRLPTLIPALVCGAGVVDFDLDPFDPTKVVVANDDGKIRVFDVPEGGLDGDMSETRGILSDPKMDKIQEIKHHPAASGLLLSLSDDHGKPTIRLWNSEKLVLLKEVPLKVSGASSLAWSPDGDKLAVGTKSKSILVLDPRSSSPPLSCAAHDSIRPCRLAWISPSHLISTGFSRAAMREIILYNVTTSEVSQLGKQSLDVSPAPLTPFADIDTNILLLFSRGERSCHAFEVQPADPKSKFTKLPSFEHGTLQSGFAFLPKIQNDVKAVEVIKALRLTPSTVECVSFSVPRARVEFYQDDIFVPTRDTTKSVCTSEEWLEGNREKLRIVDLRPAGMGLLSEAPITAAKASTRDKIAQGPVITDSQRQEAYFDKLFQAAQVDADDDEVGRKVAHGMAAPEDDDW